MNDTSKDSTSKDGWDKAKVVLEPVGGLLTALAVVVIGVVTNDKLGQRQEKDARIRLYSELMSRREDAESQLRKDMFQSIISSFLSDTAARLEAKVLNLELLSYNFHESLNLTPLFHHLLTQIARSDLPRASKREYQGQLARVASETIRKQIVLLEAAGTSVERPIALKALREDSVSSGYRVADEELQLEGITRRFHVTALKVDTIAQEVQVRLNIETPAQRLVKDREETEANFSVGFFDFPMIDNTRLSHDQRCAIVLTAYSPISVNIRLIFFPGSYAGLRERVYYQDIVDKLLAATAAGGR
jgi:hypothetical protein